MKNAKKFLALSLSAAMVMSLVACGSSDSTTESSSTAGTTSEATTSTDTAATSDEATYTLNDMMEASPTNFNPHTWEDSADAFLQDYQA